MCVLREQDAGNMFSRMSMRAVEYAGHNESQAMRMGQVRSTSLLLEQWAQAEE